jgi:chloramphenicol-sensitive protein RarD
VTPKKTPGDSAHDRASRGALATAASFLLWGFVPLYWKQMQDVSSLELVAHRIVWSLLFLACVLARQKAFSSLRPSFTEARAFASSMLSGALLAANWTLFIWAVNAGHLIEASLGYFLTPLCNVALGSAFFHERLRTLQWTAVAFAAAGVGVLLFHAGHVPWIALGLASSWSLYGICKKQSQLGAIAGLTMETFLMSPIAGAFLLWRAHTGEGALGQVSPGLHVLIVGSGVITTIPLLLFAYGAQRLRLATLGLLQYIAPSMQFLLGLLVYHEPFDTARMQAFVLIWCGLVIYTGDTFWSRRDKIWAAATMR